jgi:hypothetical protein
MIVQVTELLRTGDSEAAQKSQTGDQFIPRNDAGGGVDTWKLHLGAELQD